MLKVMIVDDHEVFRLGIRELLNSIDGFLVVAEANCCTDALAKIAAQPVDLVLLDLYLPDSDGIDAVHKLRKIIPQLHIIIISGMIDDDLLLRAVLAGVSGYLTKDTPALDIIRALQAYRRDELAMLPAVAAHAINLMIQRNNMLEADLALSQQNEMTPSDAHQVPDLPMTSSTQTSDLSHQVLTPQEEKVYQLMRRGLSNKQIAARLIISRFTVGKHVQSILRKLGVANRTQAVSYNLFEGGAEF
jgi:DNA-binding NarL/FixJ family response regulator